MVLTPSDQLKIIKHGKLWFYKNQDDQFPYIYKVDSHVLVHNTNIIKHIYFYIEDSGMATSVTHLDQAIS